ncbi:MAG: 50S ribosomal protein L11 methyltransferase [Clostridia bacterium]|nr:50S ribosomal protein L11 methyltransferase [Clostridia bacterium]
MKTSGNTGGEWTAIRATVKTPLLDRLTAIMSVIDTGLMIEDYSDFSLNGVYGELVDDSILKADRSVASVTVFIPEDSDASVPLSFLRSQLTAEGIEATVSCEPVREEDWINNWKKYYKPLHIGDRVVIVPGWENYDPAPGELTVRLDPGLAFGSGSHETTSGVIRMLEDSVRPGDSVLDVGTGSGILGIVAMKLGAGSCNAYDIDPVAAEVARENFSVNGFTDKVECGVADLLRGVKKQKYDIICANIVADIILRLLPDIGEFMKNGTLLLLSGIISERAGEIERSLAENRLAVIEETEDNGWRVIKAGRPADATTQTDRG